MKFIGQRAHKHGKERRTFSSEKYLQCKINTFLQKVHAYNPWFQLANSFFSEMKNKQIKKRRLSIKNASLSKQNKNTESIITFLPFVLFFQAWAEPEQIS